MTPEQIAALRAAIEAARGARALDELRRRLGTYQSKAILALLAHIAKLEADAKRYQWLRDEGYLNDWWSVEDNDRNVGISKTIDERIEITSSFSFTDEQRHEAVAKILKDAP